MKTDKLLNAILPILHSVKEDEKALQKILDFLEDEIIISVENEVRLPEKYNRAVKEIADNLNAGMVCFLNPDTLETDEPPQEFISEPFNYEMETGMTLEDFNPKYTEWDKYITIEPMPSNESFEIMENFANQLENSKVKTHLLAVLTNRKPFANFKRIIDNSDIREEWFDFKDRHVRNYVKTIIEIELQGEINWPFTSHDPVAIRDGVVWSISIGDECFPASFLKLPEMTIGFCTQHSIIGKFTAYSHYSGA